MSSSNPQQLQAAAWTRIDPDLNGIDLGSEEDFNSSVPLKKVPNGDIFQASRAGDVERLRYLLLEGGGGQTINVNVNARDKWDSVALYYACLAGHLDSARLLLESGAICSEHTFDGDRCHYAALNLKVRKLLKAFEARPPPLGPLQAALRDTFLASSRANRTPFGLFGASSNDDSNSAHFPSDVTFMVQGRPIEAHRIILSARSTFFKSKFQMNWKHRKEVRFSKEKLSYPALHSLIHFFYSDRLEVAVEDMEDLVRICKVCKCEGLQKLLEKELVHQKYAEYKSLRDLENSQKRFILQGLSLPEQDRLPAALYKILQASLAKSCCEDDLDNVNALISGVSATKITELEDLADICIKVDKKIFRCHQVILASRSEYFRARLSRMKDFLEGRDESTGYRLAILEEQDLSTNTFEKMIEYMYTDGLRDLDPDQAEELFDAASRYLLFPLKRAAGDVLLPHLDMLSPAELCQWLILSDTYGVLKIREYCLDVIARNLETFADTPEFRAMILTLPAPSGDSSDRTTLPSAPGSGVNSDQGNILDDLREKWLEAEAAELDKRDESAIQFDKRLEIIMVIAEQECADNHDYD